MIEQEFKDLTIKRAEALDTLIVITTKIDNAGDYGDMLGALRLAELAAQKARKSIIREARAAGETWEDIGSALAITAVLAELKYGSTD